MKYMDIDCYERGCACASSSRVAGEDTEVVEVVRLGKSQEPVAWMSPDGKFSTTEGKLFHIPLYTAPRELSDVEIHDIWKKQWESGNIGHIAYNFAKAILKKASEK